jgi:hypothetical protein
MSKGLKIQDGFDAIWRLITSAICSSDSHFVRGTVPGLQEGNIPGANGVASTNSAGTAGFPRPCAKSRHQR